MLPRLEAEEHMGLVNNLLAVGGQAMKDVNRDKYLQALQDKMHGKTTKPKKASMATFAQMGVPMRTE